MEITTQDTPTKPRSNQRRMSDIWKPHARIPRRLYSATVVISLLLLLLVWSILSYGGFVHPSYFLPTPTAVVTAASQMIQSGALVLNAEASLEEVIVGWLVAVVLAVPLGILMGS